MKEKKRVFPCELAYVLGLLTLGFSRLLNKFFTFEDKLPLRGFFEK